MNYQLRANPVLQKIRQNRVSFGIYVNVRSPAIVELAGLAGLDFVRIDAAHGLFDLPGIEALIRAAEHAGVVPFVRLGFDEDRIAAVLEAGAMGVVVPGVTDADTAKRVVDAVKFRPVGGRGMFAASRQSGYGSVDANSYREWTNREIMAGIQIESPEGAANVENIVSVPGIDLVLSGRGDLANALDLAGQKHHPRVLEMESRIFETARSYGLAVSPQLDPMADNFADQLAVVTSQGAAVVSLGTDLGIIKRSFEDVRDRAVSALC